MAEAIYQRQRTAFGGSFASDIAALTIGGDASVPLGIVQNAQLNFAQNIARIYDVSNGGASAGEGGVVPVFYVGGRTQGTASIARVLGPQSGALCNFYNKMGNICSPQDITFKFQGGCEELKASGIEGINVTGGGEREAIAGPAGTAPNNAVSYTIEAAVMTNMGVSVASQDMIVNENIQLMFANLTCEEVG
jgi:hypothetical protein